MFILAPHLFFALGLVGVGLVNGSWIYTLVVLALQGGGLRLSNRHGFGIGVTAESLLAFVALAASIAATRAVGESHLYMLRNWLAAILLLRSWRRMDKRDYVFSFMISVAIFTYLGQSYTDLPFLFLTVAYIVVGPYALFYFLAYYGGFQKTAPMPPPVRVPLTLSHVRFMSTLSLLMALMAAALFVVLPRPETGGAVPTLRSRTQTTGFSGDVPLGSFSRIVEQRGVVMVVETDRPTLWRGKALDYYEDGVWHETIRSVRPIPAEPASLPLAGDVVTRVFELLDLRWTDFQLFASGDVVAANGLGNRWRIYGRREYSTMFVDRHHLSTYGGRYRLVSREGDYIGSTRIADRNWRLPDRGQTIVSARELALQLPSDLSVRARDLARQLTANEPTTEAKAAAVERYLRENFSYSLAQLDSGNRNPIDHFLFRSRRGHCEYFATAMTLLLRAAGVPARVVQGFAPGALVDGRYVVRMNDAHLWSEVFVDGRGWKAYDPSPGGETRTRPDLDLGWVEELRLRWQTHVLLFDRDVQSGLLSAVQRGAGVAMHWVRGRSIGPGGAAAAAVVVVAAILAVLALRWRRGGPGFFVALANRFRRGRWRARRAESDFGRYLKAIARRGFGRRPGTTPDELVVALEGAGAAIADDARRLTELFNRARFGGAELRDEERRELRAAVRRVQEWASTTPSRPRG